MTKLINVLLVDDSLSFVKAARELVAALPCVGSVACANSGAEALALLGQTHFDLVLTDIAMPDMSGFGMIRALRDLDHPPRVVAVTLHEAPEYRAAVLRNGAEALITKRRFADVAPGVIAAIALECVSGFSAMAMECMSGTC